MKKLMFSLLLAGMMGAFFACQKESILTDSSELMALIANDSNADAIGVDELSASIVSYVKTNYAPLEIDLAFRSDDNGYHLILEDGQEVFFNLQNHCLDGDGDGDGHHGGGHHGGGGHGGDAGHCIKGETIETSELPQAAAEYVAAHYEGNDITVVVVKPNGKFGVELADGTVLLFDAEGAFIKECDGQNEGGGHGPGHGHGHGGHHGTNHCTAGDAVDVSTLQQPVLDYVAANFPDETIAAAVVKPNGAFAVELSGGTVLLFKSDGTYLRECGTHGGHGPGWGGTEITVDELLDAVTAYLAEHYPDATVEVAILTFHGKYFLRLSNDVKLVFDADGNILFDSGN